MISMHMLLIFKVGLIHRLTLNIKIEEVHMSENKESTTAVLFRDKAFLKWLLGQLMKIMF
jgi:hypothetical protein